MNDNNPDNQNVISDKRLDQLLQQVDVPQGLHEELLGLVDQGAGTESHDQKPRPVTSTRRSFTVSTIVVAACYLILAGGVFVFWPSDQAGTARQNAQRKETDNHGAGQPKKRESNSKTNSDAKVPETNSVLIEASLARSATLDTIENKLNQLKIQELEEKLARLENSRQMLESNESVALVLAIADQTPLNLGGSKELVSDDMKFVLEKFPASQGAEIAAQFADSGN